MSQLCYPWSLGCSAALMRHSTNAKADKLLTINYRLEMSV